jgi:hypothetical protein
MIDGFEAEKAAKLFAKDGPDGYQKTLDALEARVELACRYNRLFRSGATSSSLTHSRHLYVLLYAQVGLQHHRTDLNEVISSMRQTAQLVPRDELSVNFTYLSSL